MVRQDLSTPQQIVQSCHAIIKSTKNKSPKIHPSVIICGIKNETKLKNQLEYLQEKGIKVFPFYEPSINHALTAIASEPIPEDQKSLFKKYQLMKGGA